MSGNTQKKLSALLVAVVLVVSIVAAGGITLAQTDSGNAPQATAEDETQTTSYLRVLHASPDAPAVDVAIDNETVVTGVQFGNVSDYTTVRSGPHDVTITAAEDPDTVLFEDSVTVDQRSITTIAASGEVSENATQPFEPIVSPADPWTPDENESAIRVAHLSPDAPAVDVTAGNGSVVIADDLDYGNASTYLSVPPGNYTAEIRPATEANDGPVVATANASLENGTVTTAYALGYLNPEDAPADTPFEVVSAEDATVTIQLPGEEPLGEEEADELTEENETEDAIDENETEDGIEDNETEDGIDENETEEAVDETEDEFGDVDIEVPFGEDETEETPDDGETEPTVDDEDVEEALEEIEVNVSENEIEDAAEEDETEGIAEENETEEMAGENETEGIAEENETEEMTGDNETEETAGENETDGSADGNDTLPGTPIGE